MTCRRSLLFFFGLTLIFQAASAWANDPAQAIQDRELFEQTVDRLCKWQNSIESLRVVYTVTEAVSEAAPLAAGETTTPVENYEEHEWIWIGRVPAIGGELLRSEWRKFVGGQEVSRSQVVRDGSMQFEAEFPGRSRFPSRFRSAPVLSPLRLDFPRCHPLESLFSGHLGWSQEEFRRVAPEFFGVQTIRGVPCVGYRMPASPYYVYWLDPEHDGLPIRIDMMAGNAQEPAVIQWRWECSAYVRTKSGCWFPAKGTFGEDAGRPMSFQVREVAMNDLLLDQEFDPAGSPLPAAPIMARTGHKQQPSREPARVYHVQILSGLMNWNWGLVLGLAASLWLAATQRSRPVFQFWNEFYQKKVISWRCSWGGRIRTNPAQRRNDWSEQQVPPRAVARRRRALTASAIR